MERVALVHGTFPRTFRALARYEKISAFFGNYGKIFSARPKFFKFVREFDAYLLSENSVSSEEYSLGVDLFKNVFFADYEEGLKDGSVKKLDELSVETLENVVSTRGDSEEAKIAATVNHVDLFLDSDFLKEGVMLVDSPGLNSNSDLQPGMSLKIYQ